MLHRREIARSRREWLRWSAIGLLAGSGCGGNGARLVVVTSWSDAEREALKSSVRSAFDILWICPSDGGDPASLLEQGLRADVVLGGSASSFERLLAAGRLEAVARGEPAWWVVRRSPLGLALRRAAVSGDEARSIATGWPALGAPEWAGRLAMDDPRRDPRIRAVAASELLGKPWQPVYSDVLRAGGNARPMGRTEGTALAELTRGEADLAVTSADRVPAGREVGFVSFPGSADWIEGAGMVRGAARPDLARRFLRALRDSVDASRPPEPVAGRFRAEALLADLLGATLVDAREELRGAVRSLKASDAIEPPPWPPASIEDLKTSRDAPTLLATLAGQITPDRAFRAWLVSSWYRPPTRLAPGAGERGRRATGRGAPVPALAPRGVDRLGPAELPPDGRAGQGKGCVMIRAVLDGLVKRFDRVAVVDLDAEAPLELLPGELLVVLGPSGSGKTTLARLIAGLERPESGEVLLGERTITGLSPQERRVGLVFQDDALWPHLTVAENVAFGLRVRKVARKERRLRVDEVMAATRIDGLADRRLESLSGLQRARVALARALVVEPDLLIVDEPFDRLEPRVRPDFRDDIRRVQVELRTTTMVLTHHTREALAMADRLAVLDLGRVVQVGPPREVYARPFNAFVAQLLGPVNLIQGQAESTDNRGDVVVRTPLGRLIGRAEAGLIRGGTPVTVAIRPESLGLGAVVPSGANRFAATVDKVEFQGELQRIELRGPGDWSIWAVSLPGPSRHLEEGQSLTVSVHPEAVVVLPSALALAR